MSEPGGSSTINGVLFQLLGSLDHAIASLRCADAAVLNPAITLTLEPTGGGGDIQINTPARLIVEQWKAKDDYGPWSLNAVIDGVLPDLFLAVRPEYFDQEVEFLFKTEGRRGEWAEAEAFFHGFHGVVPLGDPRPHLDDTQRKNFFPKVREGCTNRELFSKILAAVSERKAVRSEPEELRARKLYYMLGRFRLETTPPLADLQAQIEERLADWIDVTEDARGKRREACGLLLDILRHGEVKMQGSELLRQIGLAGRECRSPAGWRQLCAATGQRVQSRTRQEGYDSLLEGRDRPAPISTAVTLIAGESGAGKTWRLATLATESAGQVPTVWVRASGRARDTLQAAAWEIWFHGLGRESQPVFELVAKRLNDVSVTGRESLAVVFVDNVQHWAELRELAVMPWETWRMQIVLTMSLALGQQLHRELPRSELRVVGEFQPKDLQRYLSRRGADWLKVPSDIRRTLLRPMLARLYCDMLATGDWRPRNEYELYAGYWRRLFEYDGQAEHPGDAGALRRLVLSTFLAESPYPWPASVLVANGISDEIRLRLERTGWLRRVGDDGAELWHDRLLNWAFAEAVAEQWRTMPASVFPSLDAIARHAGGDHAFRPVRRLGYAAADLLWIRLHENAAPPAQTLLPLLHRLEGKHVHSYETRQLYMELLPTLGPAVAPLIQARYEDIESLPPKPPIKVFAAALARTLKDDPQKAETCCRSLMQVGRADTQSLAVYVLAEVPSAGCLDALVGIHRENLRRIHLPREARGSTQAHESVHDYETSFRALVACAPCDLTWFERELTDGALTDEALADLVSVLSRIPIAAGEPLWRRHKANLLSRLSSTHRRALSGCIMRFADRQETVRLGSWIIDTGNRGIDDGFALVALCRLEPTTALACLRKVGLKVLVFFEKAVMQELWARARSETSRVLSEWMSADGEQTWRLAELYSYCPDELHGAPLRQLLQQYEHQVVNRPPGHWNGGHAICRRAELLEKLGRHAQALDEFTRWAHSPLDRELGKMIADLAAKPEPRFREDLWVVFALLARIGGDGLGIAITAWVNSDESLQPGWMEYVTLVDVCAVTDSLKKRADSLVLANSSPKKIPWDQANALILLAERGEQGKIVETVMRWGDDVIFRDLADVEELLPPMVDKDLQPAWDVLRQGTSVAARANAAYALGLSRRPEVAAELRDILVGQAFNTQLATAILEALVLLDSRDESLIPTLRQFLRRKETAAPAARLLIGCDSPGAATALAESLLAGEPPAAERFAWDVYAYLLRRPEWRARVLQRIWDARPKGAVKWFWLNSPIARFLPDIGELRTSEAEDLLWSLAFPDRPPVHTVGQAAEAIKGLAKIDPGEAFRAAELQFLEDDKDREYWVQLVAELDAKRALGLLLRQATQEVSQWGLWHIALTLGRLTRPVELLELLQPLVRSVESKDRMAAAVIASWQEDEIFASVFTELTRDSRDEVATERIHTSLERYQRSQIARRIAAVMPRHVGIRRWSFGEAWFNLSEPLRFLRRYQSEETRATLQLLPEALRRCIAKRLQKRLDEQKRKIEEEERRSRE